MYTLCTNYFSLLCNFFGQRFNGSLHWLCNFSSAGDKEYVGTTKLRECIHVLADRIGDLSRHRADLLDRHSKAKAANDQLTKELEERKELVNTLYLKHHPEKQVFFVVYKWLLNAYYVFNISNDQPRFYRNAFYIHSEVIIFWWWGLDGDVVGA